MINHSNCPVCESARILEVGSKNEVVSSPPNTLSEAGTNVILRNVLDLDSCLVTTYRCVECSHVFISPGYTENEIDLLYSKDLSAKIKAEYRLFESSTGKSWAAEHKVDKENQLRLSEKVDQKRADDLHSYITGQGMFDTTHIPTILDVGGQDGFLTERFKQSIRYVYDKDVSVQREGVIVLDSIHERHKLPLFDLMIFSHVLEHVPYPRKFISDLLGLLSPDSLVYVEVPLEYCGSVIKQKALPIGVYVNYFTPESIVRLLESVGLGVIVKVSRVGAWYGAQRMVVIKVIAKRGAGSLHPLSRLKAKLDLIYDSLLTIYTRHNVERSQHELL